MAHPAPRGVSALIGPDDEPYVAILEACAAARRTLGLPGCTRADLERLFAALDESERDDFPPGVISLAARRRIRRSRCEERR